MWNQLCNFTALIYIKEKNSRNSRETCNVNRDRWSTFLMLRQRWLQASKYSFHQLSCCHLAPKSVNNNLKKWTFNNWPWNSHENLSIVLLIKILCFIIKDNQFIDLKHLHRNALCITSLKNQVTTKQNIPFFFDNGKHTNWHESKLTTNLQSISRVGRILDNYEHVAIQVTLRPKLPPFFIPPVSQQHLISITPLSFSSHISCIPATLFIFWTMTKKSEMVLYSWQEEDSSSSG